MAYQKHQLSSLKTAGAADIPNGSTQIIFIVVHVVIIQNKMKCSVFLKKYGHSNEVLSVLTRFCNICFNTAKYPFFIPKLLAYLHICTRIFCVQHLSTHICTAYVQHSHCVIGTIGISIFYYVSLYSRDIVSWERPKHASSP